MTSPPRGGRSIPQCCWCPWLSCSGCSWRIPCDSSRSPLSVVVSCKRTFSQSEDKRHEASRLLTFTMIRFDRPIEVGPAVLSNKRPAQRSFFSGRRGRIGCNMEAIRQLPSRTARCNLLSNEYVYDCQNNLAITLINNLPCNPPPHPHPGHWWLCHCPLQNKATPHDSPAAPCLRRPLSFSAALSCAPRCLARYYICPVYCGRPPQPLSPARPYVRGETDLNTVSTVIVPPQPSLPWRTLEQPPPPLKPRLDGLTNSPSQSSPVLVIFALSVSDQVSNNG